MLKYILMVIICYTSINPVFSQPPKLNIAVNDLIGKKIDQETAGIISDRLRTELLNTGAFRVMERGVMNSVLKEQAFQKSGACNESSCLAEIGQVLGVDRMVAGSIGKLSSSLYSINLRMIDVGTGEILLAVSEDFEGNLKGVLSIAVPNSTRKLTGKSSLKRKTDATEDNKIVSNDKNAFIFISSTPPMADVYVDGMKIGRANTGELSVTPGWHTIKLKKRSKQVAKRIFFKSGKNTSQNFILK